MKLMKVPEFMPEELTMAKVSKKPKVTKFVSKPTPEPVIPTGNGQSKSFEDGSKFLLETFKKSLIEIRATPRSLYSGVCKITPDVAETILLNYAHVNRPLKKRVMETYQRDMESGHWALTGQPIIFDEKGNLLEGQHRLNACMLAKSPFETFVVMGTREDTFKYIDQGERRRAYDVFAMTGEKNTKNLQAVLRHVRAYEWGELGSSKQYPSISELEDTLKAHPTVPEFVAAAPPVPGIPPSIVGALSYLFNKADSKRAKEFFARLSDGTGLVIDSPIRALRETLRGANYRPSSRELLAMTITAWNQYFQEKPLRRVKWDAGKHPFPKIVGLQIDSDEAAKEDAIVKAS